MTEPLPLDPGARRALAVWNTETAAPLSPGQLATTWSGAVQRTRREARGGVLALAFAVSCLAGIAAVQLAWPVSRPAPVAPTEVAWFQPQGAASYRVDGARLELQSGAVRVTASGARREVHTAELTVELTDARVLVETTTGRTVLSVERGEVVWHDGTGPHRAVAGERVVVPVELTVAPAPDVTGCAGALTCLDAKAHGTGLAAQTALFELGALAHEAGQPGAALVHFREYQRRFPDGALSPEVSIAVMLDARATGELDAARAEAEAFVSRFPDDPRVPDVTRWRKQVR